MLVVYSVCCESVRLLRLLIRILQDPPVVDETLLVSGRASNFREAGLEVGDGELGRKESCK